MAPVEEKLQQDPQLCWSLTGLTLFSAVQFLKAGASTPLL